MINVFAKTDNSTLKLELGHGPIPNRPSLRFKMKNNFVYLTNKVEVARIRKMAQDILDHTEAYKS